MVEWDHLSWSITWISTHSTPQKLRAGRESKLAGVLIFQFPGSDSWNNCKYFCLVILGYFPLARMALPPTTLTTPRKPTIGNGQKFTAYRPSPPRITQTNSSWFTGRAKVRILCALKLSTGRLFWLWRCYSMVPSQGVILLKVLTELLRNLEEQWNSG